MNKIYLGADHAGFALKEKLKKWLEQKKIPYQDLGNKVLNPKDDYPDYAVKVAKAVANGKSAVKSKGESFGVLCCGSAQGMAITANKVKGIRAVVPFSVKEAELGREHNDANVLCLSGWYFSSTKAVALLQKFLSTPFSGAVRHKRRVRKIERIEKMKL